jgi:D-sedoheptulose 7-phosphate isomerase
MSLDEHILQILDTNIRTTQAISAELTGLIAQAGETLVHCLLSDGKILACGNGASAAQANIFAAAMVNRFERERPSLPAMALSSDAQTISAISNDYSFSEVFAKPIRALGKAGDILLVISPTGNSPNIVQALQAARDREMRLIALTGVDGGDLARLLYAEDIEIRIPSEDTTRIIESHLLITHLLCDLIDTQLFGVN